MSRFWTRRDNQGTSQYVPLPLDFIAGKIQQEQQGFDVGKEAATNAILKSAYINEPTGEYAHWNQTPLYLQKQKEVQQKKNELIEQLNNDPFAWKDVYNKTNKLKQDYYNDPDVIAMDESAKEFAKLKERRNKLGVKWREFNDPYLNQKYGKGLITDDKGNIIKANTFGFNNIDEYVDYLPVSEQIMKKITPSGSKTGWTQDKNGYIYHYTQGHEGISGQDISNYIGIPIVQDDKGKYKLNFYDGTVTEPVKAFLDTDAGKQFVKQKQYEIQRYEKRDATDSDIIGAVKEELYREGRKQIFSKDEYNETKKNDALHTGIALANYNHALTVKQPLYLPGNNDIVTPETHANTKEILTKNKQVIADQSKNLDNQYSIIGDKMGIQDQPNTIGGAFVNAVTGKDKISIAKQRIQQVNNAINPDTKKVDRSKLPTDHPLLRMSDDDANKIVQDILITNGLQQQYNDNNNAIIETENNLKVINKNAIKYGGFDIKEEFNKLGKEEKEIVKTPERLENILLNSDDPNFLNNPLSRLASTGFTNLYLRYHKAKNDYLSTNPSIGEEQIDYMPGEGSSQYVLMNQVNNAYKNNFNAIKKLRIQNSDKTIEDMIASGELPKNLDTKDIHLIPGTGTIAGKPGYTLVYNGLVEKDGKLQRNGKLEQIKVFADPRYYTNIRTGIAQALNENEKALTSGTISKDQYEKNRAMYFTQFGETTFINPEVINEGKLRMSKEGEHLVQESDINPNVKFEVIPGKIDPEQPNKRIYELRIINKNDPKDVMSYNVNSTGVKQIIGQYGALSSDYSLNSPYLSHNTGIDMQNKQRKIDDELKKTANKNTGEQ